MHYMDKPTRTQLEGVAIGRETGVALGSDLTAETVRHRVHKETDGHYCVIQIKPAAIAT